MNTDVLAVALPIAVAVGYLLRMYAKQAALLTMAVINSSYSATNSLSSLAASMASWSSRPCLLTGPEGADPVAISNPTPPDLQQQV